ncbi:MAG: shikimate kinase, partial [Pirellula sp.]
MSSAHSSRRHVFLIGYRGSGKSTLGRGLASSVNRPFIDSDHWIEEQSGCSIPDLFTQQGEPAFRDWETRALETICDARTPDSIVSLGGGAILRERHRNWIREHGHAVWLVASPGTLAKRIEQDIASGRSRPSLTSLGTLREIETVLAQREPLYRETADTILDV